MSIAFLIHYTVILFLFPLMVHILISNKRKISSLTVFILSFAPIFLSWFIIKEHYSSNINTLKTISFFAQYKNSFFQTISSGFKDSFGIEFIKVIISNLGVLGPSLFIFSIISIFLLLKSKRFKLELVIILMFFFIIGFFILAYPSHSHNSRYPTFAFIPVIFLGSFFIGHVIYKLQRIKLINLFLVGIIIFLVVLTPSLSSIYSYKNIYVSRIQVGQFIVSDDQSCSYALEGWPSTMSSIIKEDSTNKIFILGFDLKRGLIMEIDEKFIEQNNICYFVYEQVTCFNDKCPNQYFTNKFEKLGYSLILEKEIQDPISKSRFIKIYKLTQNET